MRVVFVCTGNTCRSPMLKFMFENYLKSIGATDIEVDSAGTMQHEKPMSEETRTVLDLHGVPHGENISKFCSAEVLGSADYIFTMTRSHAREIARIHGAKYNAIPLAHIIGSDVPDPYGQGVAAYESVYKVFEEALPKIYGYIHK